MHAILLALALWADPQAGSITTFEPAYPVAAYQGGTVVAVLELAKGSVKNVRILSGDKPFAEPAAAALRQWRFPADRTNPALAVVNFRGPNLYSMGSSEHAVDARAVPDSLPRPRSVTEPRYPPKSLGQGSAILQLSLTRKGTVAEARVLKGASDLAQACTEAVRTWKFDPPRKMHADAPAPEAFAVCVFRQPVLSAPR